MSLFVAAIILTLTILTSILARRVADEMTYLEKPLRVLQAFGGLALLFVLPWWFALLITGGLALGWIPMAAAIGVLAAISAGTSSTSTQVAAIAFALAILSGARWTLDKRSPVAYAKAVVAFAAACIGIRFIGGF